MYYNEGYATIGYKISEKKTYIEYMVGPRYGRGFVYPIIEGEDGLALGERELLWIS